MKLVWVLGLTLALQTWAQDAGRKIFESQCALCHGQKGGGGRGPALNRPKLEKARDDAALRKLIEEGSGDMPGAGRFHPDGGVGGAAYGRPRGKRPRKAVPGDK